jgi:P pilus assembly chaperone PapD
LSNVLRLTAIILVITSIAFLPSAALAMGVGVTPGRMEFSTRPGGVHAQTLYVINQSTEQSKFRVFVDGSEVSEWFKITPDEFTLAPKHSTAVEITFAPPLIADPGKHNVDICVVSIPTGSDLRVGAGIKVQTQVEITGLPLMSLQWWVLSAVLIVALVVTLLVWRYRSHSRRFARKEGDVD